MRPHVYSVETELHLSAGNMLRALIPPKAGFFFHPPNQGKRAKVTNIMFAAMGMLVGISDLVLVAAPKVPGEDGGGIGFLELKHPKAKIASSLLTPEQREFRAMCANLGLPYACVNTLDGVEQFARSFYAARGWKLRGKLQ